MTSFIDVGSVASLPSMASDGVQSKVQGLTSAVNAITAMGTTWLILSLGEPHQGTLENLLEIAALLSVPKPLVASEELKWSVDHTGGGEIKMEDQAVLELSVRW